MHTYRQSLAAFVCPHRFFTTTRTIKLAVRHQLLLVLMRRHLGLMFTDLGKQFGISRTTASCKAQGRKDNSLVAQRYSGKNKASELQCTVHYPKATCIIDCTEIFVQRPKNLRKRAQTYSNYKHHNTYKALYCIAANGFVMCVSKLFGGRASDTFITKNSSLIGNQIPGDQVLADRGFTITVVFFLLE